MSIVRRQIKKKQPIQQPVEDDWNDLEDYYRKVQDKTDNDTAFLIPLIMASAVAISVELLSDEGKGQLASVIGITPDIEVPEQNVPILDIIMQDSHDKEAQQIVNSLSEQDIQTAMTIGGEIRSDWLASDMKTVENSDIKNMQNIMDQIGMFGSVEAQKGATLESYQELQQAQGFEAWMPWTDAGDENVCDDCLELTANGPYRVDAFPEPPHYGCRCNEEMAEPIIVPIGMEVDEVVEMME